MFLNQRKLHVSNYPLWYSNVSQRELLAKGFLCVVDQTDEQQNMLPLEDNEGRYGIRMNFLGIL